MTAATPHSDDLPWRIREAVAAGELAKAHQLWRQFGERLRADGACGPVSRIRLREACELAEWTRMMALCARSFARDRLSQIAVAQKYGYHTNSAKSIVAVRG